MKIAFSWDDGAKEDLKLFELHHKYEIPGMFFVPTRNQEGREVLSPGEIQRHASELISFGGHTKNHVYLTTIPLENVEEELTDNQKYLEDILGGPVRDFCLPGGKYNQSVLELVYRHFDTCRTAETVCFQSSITSGKKLLRPSFHFFPRGKVSLVGNALRNHYWLDACDFVMHYSEDYYETIQRQIRKKEASEAEVIVWGHSWEIEEYGLWGRLEELMQYLCENEKGQIVSYDRL